MTVADLSAKLGLDASGFDRGMDRVVGSSGRLSSVGGKMTNAGKKMTMGITLPIVALGAVAVNMAAKFETSMNQVQAASGASAEEMKGLSDYAMKMGADTMFSAGEAADAMLDLSKGGMTAAQIKAGGLAAALDLAAAGNLELAQAAETTIQAMGMFNLKAGQAGDVADALAGGANASTASVEGLALALSQVGPGAGIAGMSLQQTVSVLAEFADKGIQGSDAGTSLKTMLSRLVPTTSAAAMAMDKYNLSFIDGKGRIDDISVVAEKLKDKLGGLTQAQQSAAMTQIFGSDAMRAATVLMQGGSEGLEKYIKATNDKNAADKMADARTKGLAGAMESLKGSLETVAIALSQVAVPAMTVIAKKITGVVNAFMGLSDAQKKWVLIAAGTAAAAGPLLVGLGKMAQGVAAAVKMYQGLKVAILGATVAQGALTAAQGAGGVAGSAASVSKGPGMRVLGGAAGAAAPVAAGAGLSAGSIAAIAAIALSPVVIAAIMTKTQKYVEGRSGAAATSAQNKGAGGAFYGSSKGYGGGAGRAAYQEDAEAAEKAAATIGVAMAKLGAKAATATGPAFDRIREQMMNIQKLTDKGFEFGDIKAKHTDSQMRSIRDRIMSTLHITQKQADAIMASMFKSWRPQPTVMGKINPAMAAAEARINQLRANAARQIKFGGADVTGLLNSIGQVIGRMQALGMSADSAAQAVGRALHHAGGGAGGAWDPLGAGATGAIVTRPTFALIGESGPEAVVPLNTTDGASALGDLSGSGNGRSNVSNLTFGSVSIVLPPGDYGDSEDAGSAAADAFMQRTREIARGY